MIEDLKFLQFIARLFSVDHSEEILNTTAVEVRCFDRKQTVNGKYKVSARVHGERIDRTAIFLCQKEVTLEAVEISHYTVHVDGLVVKRKEFQATAMPGDVITFRVFVDIRGDWNKRFHGPRT